MGRVIGFWHIHLLNKSREKTYSRKTGKKETSRTMEATGKGTCKHKETTMITPTQNVFIILLFYSLFILADCDVACIDHSPQSRVTHQSRGCREPEAEGSCTLEQITKSIKKHRHLLGTRNDCAWFLDFCLCECLCL